jgi:predicted aminopeptidase
LARDSLLIDTLFHELVHLNFYFEDQADFNEAFATWFSYKVSKNFIEKSLYVENKLKTLRELEQEEKADNELYSFLREVLERGEEFYVKKPLPKRELFFDWVSGCTKKYTHLKSLQNVKWNNAAILSLSTYLKLLPLIDKYAEREKLTPQEFLSKVKQEKESLVNIIQAQELGTSSFRCNEKLP